jgi:hypothetical protein
MKLWALAGLFTIAFVPWAHASEAAIECGLQTPQLLREATIVGVDAPAQVTRKAARPAREEASANPSGAAASRPSQQNEQRRRGGSLRRIPDAMLIDGRGVL